MTSWVFARKNAFLGGGTRMKSIRSTKRRILGPSATVMSYKLGKASSVVSATLHDHARVREAAIRLPHEPDAQSVQQVLRRFCFWG